MSAHLLHTKGIGPMLDLVPKGADLLVTFDCDALDPSVMPAVIGRAPGGLTYWQAIELIQGASERGRIAAFDLVEFMPARDVAGLGALTAGRIIAYVIGLVARATAK
ncbi:MAG: arginase family protein [Hyphomicrobiales bacterium]